ncbi:hypothetical protein AVEN_174682-1 [Araneus ventricosus]|uniref:Uncharacterized protein n=1 Tax=Araneus ventricosus TaxID=182803 RepID=A0A4Y2BMA8_ARAVE|nr:hypothetical protein AVEN_174682-1 [Araneus ventricosus]
MLSAKCFVHRLNVFDAASEPGRSLLPFSRPFTSLPKWNFWNTGRKKQSSVLETDGNWYSGMTKLEFQRTQNPTLHAPIPIWCLDAMIAAHQRICLNWNLATRLENRKSAVWGRRNRGIEERW